MKFKNSFLQLPLLIGVLLFLSCSGEDTMDADTTADGTEENEMGENLETYFTLNVSEDYFPSESQNWIVIHFSDSDIADYREITNGNTYNFEKLPSEIGGNNAFNITFITSNVTNNNRSNAISTFTLVGRGDAYTLSKSTQNSTTPDPKSNGSFNLNVEALISPATTTISFNGGPLGGGGQSETINGLTNYRFPNVNLYDPSRYLFSVYDVFGRGSYSFLENITDGSDVTIDRTQLRPYDTTVPVSIPENGEFFAQVLAFEEDQTITGRGGFVTCLVFPFDNENFTTNLFELGYINGFENYYTLFTYESEDFYYYFKKVGEKPLSIIVPQGNFDTTVTLLDESLTFRFRYESPLDALSTRKSALWSTTSGTFGEDYVRTTWSFLTGRNPFPITSSLPDEILQSIPTLDIENLEYESMQFYLADISYYNYLNATFVENDRTLQDNLEFIRVFK